MTASVKAASASKLEAIQLLRALAASMVVVGHLIGTVEHRPDLFGPVIEARYAGGAGVDVFFLISGFIMVFASRRMFGSVAGARDFMLRRLVRIAPLYWATTALALALLMLKGAAPDGRAIAASFGFIPYEVGGLGNGFAFPIVDLGWTLNYEMMFYVLFALFIPLGRQRAVIGLGATMLTIVVLGAIFKPGYVALRFWSQPIILEFVLGTLIALAYGAGRLRLSPLVRVTLVACAAAVYLYDPCGLMGRPVTPNGIERVIGWGLPSMLILIAAIAGETPLHSRIARMGVLLGDASYALYLLHPFVIAAMIRVARLPLFSAPGGGVAFVVMTGVAACIGAVVVHTWVERPVTTWLTRRLQRAGAPITAVPIVPAAGSPPPPGR